MDILSSQPVEVKTPPHLLVIHKTRIPPRLLCTKTTFVLKAIISHLHPPLSLELPW